MFNWELNPNGESNCQVALENADLCRVRRLLMGARLLSACPVPGIRV